MIIAFAHVLKDDEVALLSELLDAAPVEEGRRTAGWHARLVKDNRQLVPGTAAAEAAQQLVLTALRRHALFSAAALPRRIAPPLIVRYEPGMTYGSHVDDAIMGGEAPIRADLSVTIFLSRPEEYEGGELVLDGTDGERPFKLPAGAAIIYPATALHRVAPVAAGVRKAAVTWVQSLVRGAAEREILWDVDRSRRALFEESGKSAAFDALSKAHANLLRLWAEP